MQSTRAPLLLLGLVIATMAVGWLSGSQFVQGYVRMLARALMMPGLILTLGGVGLTMPQAIAVSVTTWAGLVYLLVRITKKGGAA